MEKREGGALSRLKKGLRLSGKELLIILCGAVALMCIAIMPSRMGDTAEEAASVSVSTQLEERLAATLSQIRGAGRVEVMVTYTQSGESTGGWLSLSQSNTRQEVVGVIIVAQGARDIGVTFELVTAARTVLGVKASMVKVFVMNDA
ncbi:MAG: hypothetical protein E7315_00355 [Clostridiales bacterium]|nr:hypothetical protein [Clostridiales bacterium]